MSQTKLKELPMHIQKKVLVTALLAGFAAVPTLAMAQAKGGNADLGFYAGASVGQSKADCPGGGSCDDKDTAYRIFGGYKFHPNIAVEGGYAPLGERSSSRPGGNVTAEANAWDIVGVGSWPLGNNFSILGKLGFYNAEIKLGGLVSGKKTTTDLTYGVGGQYDFNRNLGLRLEWNRYSGVKFAGPSGGDTDIDVLSVGALWRF
jgi:OOP family OmpA-OmpF porin